MAGPKAPTKREEAKAVIDQVRALMLAGRSAAAAELRPEAEAAIRAASPRDRRALTEGLEEAFTVLPEPSAELAVTSYHDVDGVDQLVDQGVSSVREAVNTGLKAADMARQIADLLLEARLKMRNRAGLPDIVASSKYTKNIAHDLFVKAREGVTEEDVHRWDTHRSLAKAVRNRMSDVVVAHLRGLDENPSQFATLYPQAKARFPKLSPTEAVYALYEAEGISLPRKGRTELAREDARRRAALVQAAIAGQLTTAGEDEDSEEEVQKDLVALERVERSFTRMTSRAARLDPKARAALKARINETITNLAAAAASL